MARTRLQKTDLTKKQEKVLREEIKSLTEFPIQYNYAMPTKYNPETMIPRMLELVKEGHSLTYVAVSFGVTRSRFFSWAVKYQELSDAIELAKDLSEIVWEEIGAMGMKSAFFNNKMYEMQVKHRFNWSVGKDASVNVAINNSNNSEEKSATPKMDLSKLSVDDLRTLKRIHQSAIPEEEEYQDAEVVG